MKLSEKVKIFRKNLNLSQKDLGKKVGIDQKQICRYETGESDPPIDILKKLAEVFGVTVDFLLNDSKDNALTKFGFNDKELFIYCQTIDKMPEEIRKAVKLLLKIVAISGKIIK